MRIHKYLFLLLFFTSYAWATTDKAEIIEVSEEITTDEPTPQGPFVSIPMHIENIRLVDSHDLYRKWTYDRVFVNNSGVGATFTIYERWMDSPLFPTKHKKLKVNIRLEPHQTKTNQGMSWVQGGSGRSVDDLHFKTRGIYYGVDDNGKAVKAEYVVEE